jgi:hypothetical protein
VELLPAGWALGARDAGEKRFPKALLQRVQVCGGLRPEPQDSVHLSFPEFTAVPDRASGTGLPAAAARHISARFIIKSTTIA